MNFASNCNLTEHTFTRPENGGAWTKYGELAFEFPSSLDALLYCFDRQMVDMQMVARFVDPAINFSCSVSDANSGR